MFAFVASRKTDAHAFSQSYTYAGVYHHAEKMDDFMKILLEFAEDIFFFATGERLRHVGLASEHRCMCGL